jgi:hypothetical protein
MSVAISIVSFTTSVWLSNWYYLESQRAAGAKAGVQAVYLRLGKPPKNRRFRFDHVDQHGHRFLFSLH